MTGIVAIVLSLLSFGLKPIHEKNAAIYNKKATLSAIADHLGVDFAKITDDQVQEIFDKNIEQLVLDTKGNLLTSEEVISKGYTGGKAEDVDMAKEKKKPVDEQIIPLYIFTGNGGDKYYILNVRGNGLWDAIWGSVALKDDKNTIAGVSFDHTGETPGLGAEIKDNQEWKNQFEGKSIYDDSGNFVSISVVKGGADDSDQHAIDGITGATITGDGVDKMLKKGIAYYVPYLKKNN